MRLRISARRRSDKPALCCGVRSTYVLHNHLNLPRYCTPYLLRMIYVSVRYILKASRGDAPRSTEYLPANAMAMSRSKDTARGRTCNFAARRRFAHDADAIRRRVQRMQWVCSGSRDTCCTYFVVSGCVTVCKGQTVNGQRCMVGYGECTVASARRV